MTETEWLNETRRSQWMMSIYKPTPAVGSNTVPQPLWPSSAPSRNGQVSRKNNTIRLPAENALALCRW